MDLFSMSAQKNAPLADRMRPQNLKDFYGQKHIIYPNSFLYRAISNSTLGSCIFYGQPGTGKTTLAEIIAKMTGSLYIKINAVSSGVAEAKEIISIAKTNFDLYGKRTYLILDECHRWSKAQSDSVLEAIEKGSIIFIGTTTENPFVNLTKAIVSRCQLFEFKKLSDFEIEQILYNAINDSKDGLGNINTLVDDKALSHIAFASDGDVRKALNSLELAVNTTSYDENKQIHITLKVAEDCTQKKSLSLDKNDYYDTLSAFCKSLRGSDVEGALYYSNRLIESGVDPLVIARRLIVHSSEDVGMANSNALVVAVSALTAIERIGFPEGKIPLTHAIIYVCESAKSNSVIKALRNVEDDIKNHKDDKVPSYLKNNTFTNGEPNKYKYPHDFGGYVKQQYMPDSLKDRVYYIPSNNGSEKGLIRKKIK